MNIITIMSDEHSYHAMSNSGNLFTETPNLDRLANMGVNFRNCYSTCPVCAPARAAWFTGQYVGRLGTWDNSTPYDGTQEGIASWLGKHNHPVYHIGKTHFHFQGEFGFENIELPGYLESPDLGCYYRDKKVARLGAEKRFQKIGIKEKESKDDLVIRKSLEWIDQHHDEDGWSLGIGLLDPHFPFYVEKEHWDHFAEKIKELPISSKGPFTSLRDPLTQLRTYFRGDMVDDEILRKVFIGYNAAITELDNHIGEVLAKLEEYDMLDNTIVIYTSDHGEQMGYHGMWWKCCMFEQSAHIPMIVYHPHLQHRVVDAPIELVDLFPTMCDVFGVEQPKPLDGHSLLPLMETGKDDARPDFAFSEYNAHGISEGQYMIRWNKYKYVYFTGGYTPQLFNLEDDLAEDHDLAIERPDDPEVKRVMEICHEKLYSVTNPEEVTARSLEFQARMKKQFNLPEEYTLERSWTGVPHPEYKAWHK